VSSEWDEKSVFLAALELPAEQREEYLRSACPDDAARERIEGLLRHHETVTREILNAVPPAQREAGPESLTRIEEFQIVRRLGEGGMGVVYLAEDLILGRRVALKVIAPGLTSSEQALARFRSEARSTAAIKHPAIVPVYKFGSDGTTHYIASEYVDGPTVAQAIEAERGRRTGRTGTAELKAWHRTSAETVSVIAEALEAAHREQIIHRDVKPSNMLLDRVQGPRLTDFGIARHLAKDKDSKITTLIGTCHYMSPEQASIADTRVDQRSDVFSLGVVLYELVCLRRPFDGSTHTEILRAVTEKDPSRLRTIDPGIPRDIEVICQKAMEKKPADRYQTAGHVAADLRCFLEDRPILAVPPSLARRTRHWIGQHRLLLAAATCVVLLLAIGGLGLKVRAARGATFGWLNVQSDLPAALVYAQRVDTDTFELYPTPGLLGTTPVVNRWLPLGRYRITVLDPDRGSSVEFNTLLLDPGRDDFRRLIAHASPTPRPSGNWDWDPNVRHGFLRDPTTSASADEVFVEAGAYLIGWSATETGGLVRERTVSLPAFYIDRREVSNREYNAFVDATGHPQPDHWKKFGFDERLADHPVVNVTFEDAEAYARWRGKRLPTALEWQAATRGPEGRAYAWGDRLEDGPSIRMPPPEVREQLQSPNKRTLYELYSRNTSPVAHADPATSVGALLHAFGNVRELTASIELPKRDVVIMGRGWSDSPAHTPLGYTRSYPMSAYSYMNGFRCARSAQSQRS
jgi:serine/threonine protein kinase/formylglycine-generating enzyme required for sulfatase activity